MKTVLKFENKLGVRSYRTWADRKRAITQLRKHGMNYFVCYREAADKVADQHFGLQYGVAAWVRPGHYYVDR